MLKHNLESESLLKTIACLCGELTSLTSPDQIQHFRTLKTIQVQHVLRRGVITFSEQVCTQTFVTSDVSPGP